MTLYILIGFLSGAFTFSATDNLKTTCVREKAATGPTLILKIEVRAANCYQGSGFSGMGCNSSPATWDDVSKVTCEKYQPPKVWREAGPDKTCPPDPRCPCKPSYPCSVGLGCPCPVQELIISDEAADKAKKN